MRRKQVSRRQKQFSANGWYPRRRGINRYENEGLANLNDTGLHDFLCRRCGYRKQEGAEPPAGVWIGSIRVILALGNNKRVRSLSDLRDGFKKLSDKLRWINILPVSKGINAYVIDKFEVHDSDGQLWRVDAHSTTDWRKPVYSRVEEAGSSQWVAENGDGPSPQPAPNDSCGPSSIDRGLTTDANASIYKGYTEVHNGSPAVPLRKPRAKSSASLESSSQVVDSNDTCGSLRTENGEGRVVESMDRSVPADPEFNSGPENLLPQRNFLPPEETSVAQPEPGKLLTRNLEGLPDWIVRSMPKIDPAQKNEFVYQLAREEHGASSLAWQFWRGLECPAGISQGIASWVPKFTKLLQTYTFEDLSHAMHWLFFIDDFWVSKHLMNRHDGRDPMDYLLEEDRWGRKIVEAFRAYRRGLENAERREKLNAPPAPEIKKLSHWETHYSAEAFAQRERDLADYHVRKAAKAEAEAKAKAEAEQALKESDTNDQPN